MASTLLQDLRHAATATTAKPGDRSSSRTPAGHEGDPVIALRAE